MSVEPFSEQIEHSAERNGIRVSCQIQRTKQEQAVEQSIWITVDTTGNLTDIEGDIRERIAELLNKCIRGINNP